MANENNLRPFTSEQSHEEAVENGRKGGIASGESKRAKKLLRECLEFLLEKELTDQSGKTVTGAEALAAKVFKQALSGDLRAFEIVRDTAGQKPVERVMYADVDAEVISQVEGMVKGE